MKILITGAKGQLGSDLVEALSPRHEVHPFDLDLDITNREQLFKVVPSVRPDVVVHAAAKTDVDGCELEPDGAYRVNASGTQNVALACRECGAAIVYISTDFVFDGKVSEPYAESDTPNPLSVYGKSKLAGENYITTLLQDYFIVRTAWLYGQHGRNFVKTILQLADERDEIKVVDDQVGSPTYSRDLAEKLSELLETQWYGLYHITNTGSCSWFEFARAILEDSGRDSSKIRPIKSSELYRPAPRPAYSVLRNGTLERRGIGILRDYRAALQEYLSVQGSQLKGERAC